MRRARQRSGVAVAADVLSFLLLLGGAAAGAGCSVGSGNGSVQGPIFVVGCSDDGSNFGTPAFGTPVTPKVFNLSPSFFAGEPIDDIATGPKANRVLIRIQRNGNGIQINDTLYVDVQNAFEVARCVRGRTVNGVPDWDTTGGWCDWSGAGTGDGGLEAGVADAAGADAAAAGAIDAAASADAAAVDGSALDGGATAMTAAQARIHLSTQGVVRSSLSLLYTCHLDNLVGLAVDGWIDFLDFGTAAQANLRPDMRTAVDPNFKINFDDRLRANLHVDLGDQRVIIAIMTMVAIPAPSIGGSLDGFFDFDLERGRGAQPFP